MITRLCVYDFDSTMIDTPLPDVGKEIWKQKTGNEYPHVGWWGRKESLDMDIFEIKPFSPVLNQFNDDNNRNDTYTVVLTSRLEKLRPQIQSILEKYKIFPNQVLLKEDGKEKNERVEKLLEELPTVTEVNIYDDREKEFRVFSKLKNDNPDLNINIYKVSNGNISLLEQKNKLLDIIENVIVEYNNLNEAKKSVEKSLLSSKKIPVEMKNKIKDYLLSGSKYDNGHVKGLSKPKDLIKKTNKINGVSLGADKDGFYVYTHRGRSKSYSLPEKIPVKDIDYIETTG